MRHWKRLLLAASISLFAAVPGTAWEPYDETGEGCCWDCAHYLYTSPSGETQERWDCLAFDCRSGWRDCWQHADSSKGCVLMWNCKYI